MKVLIEKSRGFIGEISVPSDKSISHRAAFFGALASNELKIKNMNMAEDCSSTLSCLSKIGVEIKKVAENEIIISGKNLFGFKEPGEVLNAGNSGTTARFLLGLLSGQDFFSVIDGDQSLRGRPMKRIADPLQMMGARIFGREGGNKLPIAVLGNNLVGISYPMPIPSAQLKTAVILSGFLSNGDTVIQERIPSRDHTERMLVYFNAPIKVENNEISIEGRKHFEAGDIQIPGDFSSACFFIAAALLVKDSRVLLPDVGVNPTRTGFLQLVRKMGGHIEVNDQHLDCNEPRGTLEVQTSDLVGTEVLAEDVPSLIDEIPLVGLLATQAQGTTIVSGASELRVKESDRIGSICANLRAMGVVLEEKDDGFIIEGPQRLTGGRINSFGDHRIAMTMAIAGLLAEGSTEIDGFECFKISFPGFYDALRTWQNA